MSQSVTPLRTWFGSRSAVLALTAGLGLTPLPAMAATPLRSVVFDDAIVVDTNGDGILDIVTIGRDPSAAAKAPAVYEILLGKADGTFNSSVTQPLPSKAFAVSKNIAKAARKSSSYVVTSLEISSALGKSGLPDLYFCLHQSTATAEACPYYLLRSRGDGTFRHAKAVKKVNLGTLSHANLNLPTFPIQSTVDLNSDGNPDLVSFRYVDATVAGVKQSLPAIEVSLLNKQQGVITKVSYPLQASSEFAFNPFVTYDPATLRVSTSDIQKDGKKALVFTIRGSSRVGPGPQSFTVAGVLPSTGAGSFNAAGLTTQSSGPAFVVVTDFNKDGLPEFIVAPSLPSIARPGTFFAYVNSLQLFLK